MLIANLLGSIRAVCLLHLSPIIYFLNLSQAEIPRVPKIAVETAKVLQIRLVSHVAFQTFLDVLLNAPLAADDEHIMLLLFVLFIFFTYFKLKSFASLIHRFIFELLLILLL
jgi:uncharacterized membrane protein